MVLDCKTALTTQAKLPTNAYFSDAFTAHV